MRKRIFADNLNAILRHNREQHSWKMGVNQFTDQSEEERRSYLGLDRARLYQEKKTTEKHFRPDATGFVPPLHKDWRDEGVISTVKDQGKCGRSSFLLGGPVLEHFFPLVEA